MIEEYPQLYNGNAYTVTITKLYRRSDVCRIRIYEGQKRWFSKPVYDDSRVVPYPADYCQLVKDAFREYQRELDREPYIDNSVQEFMTMGEIKEEEF